MLQIHPADPIRVAGAMKWLVGACSPDPCLMGSRVATDTSHLLYPQLNAGCCTPSTLSSMSCFSNALPFANVQANAGVRFSVSTTILRRELDSKSLDHEWWLCAVLELSSCSSTTACL
jgi:hypothetical protein